MFRPRCSCCRSESSRPSSIVVDRRRCPSSLSIVGLVAVVVVVVVVVVAVVVAVVVVVVVVAANIIRVVASVHRTVAAGQEEANVYDDSLYYATLLVFSELP